jgi:hypothetical protein
MDCSLAAIMAVDVVGYSRLVGLYEAGTLVRVRCRAERRAPACSMEPAGETCEEIGRPNRRVSLCRTERKHDLG